MSIFGVSALLMLMAFHVGVETELQSLSLDLDSNVVLAANSSSGTECRHQVGLRSKGYESSQNCYTSTTTSAPEFSLTSSGWVYYRDSSLEMSFVPNRPSEATRVGGTLESMRVLWTVAGYVLGPQAELDNAQARALIFSPLDMTDDSISFSGRVCQPISFSRKTSRLSEYLSAEYGVSPQDLNLEDQSVQIIQTTCDIPGFSEFLRLKDMRLVVTIDGVFYFFDPFIFR